MERLQLQRCRQTVARNRANSVAQVVKAIGAMASRITAAAHTAFDAGQFFRQRTT